MATLDLMILLGGKTALVTSGNQAITLALREYHEVTRVRLK